MNFILQSKSDLFPQLSGECHASTLVALPDGGFAAAWFQGTKEGRNDVAIYGTRMEPDGRWLQPVQWAKVNALPHWNPVLFLPSPQKLLLFFKVGSPDELWHTWIQESNDGGRNWSPARELVRGAPDARGPVKNKPIRLSDGAILAGNSLENDERWCVLTDRSTDDGATWTSSAIIKQTRTPGDLGVIQPTLWESPPGHVHMLTRSTSGFIYRSDSDDFGRTWSPIRPTVLPNNNSGIDLAQADDGRLLLAYNNPPDGRRRTPLTLAVSEDNGETWQNLHELENADGEFSYPAVIHLGQNRFAGTYTNRRKTITFWQGSLL